MITVEPFVLMKWFPALSVQKTSVIVITTRPYMLLEVRSISRLYLIPGSIILSEDARTWAGPFSMTYKDV